MVTKIGIWRTVIPLEDHVSIEMGEAEISLMGFDPGLKVTHALTKLLCTI